MNRGLKDEDPLIVVGAAVIDANGFVGALALNPQDAAGPHGQLGLARLMVVELEHGMGSAAVAKGAVEHLGKRLQAFGGVIVIGREGPPEAAFHTAAMPFAVAP